MTSRMLIGQLLVEQGYIDAWQLQSALAHQRFWGGRIGEALVRLGFISEPVLLTELGRRQRYRARHRAAPGVAGRRAIRA